MVCSTLHLTLDPCVPGSLLHPLQVLRSELIRLQRGVVHPGWLLLLLPFFVVLRPPVLRQLLHVFVQSGALLGCYAIRIFVFFFGASGRQRLVLERIAGPPIRANILLLLDREVADLSYRGRREPLFFVQVRDGHFDLLGVEVGCESSGARPIVRLEVGVAGGGLELTLTVLLGVVLDRLVKGRVGILEGALGVVLAWSVGEDRVVV